MSLITGHMDSYDRISKFSSGKLLMLGSQENLTGKDPREIFHCSEYKTLDPDGGDFSLDLTGDLSIMNQTWDCVINIGTIEHIWDAHKAYSNCAKLVKVGGYFVGHAPVTGYPNHGIHVTSAGAILSFFRKNGFEIIDIWETKWDHDRNTILWHIAKKVDHVENFSVPTQIWENGRDAGFS